MEPVVPLIVAFCAIPVAYLAGRVKPAWSAWIAAVAAFAALIVVGNSKLASFETMWAAAWDLKLSFTLDGLAALFLVCVFGVGTAVFVYSARYLPDHLQSTKRPETERLRFDALMLLFMASMAGLVLASDLFLLFVFWELTTLASFFLIGFDRTDEGRRAALMAMIVTGSGGLLLLAALVLLHVETRTFELAALSAAALDPGRATLIGALILGAAATKSAQVPFHFWLPRAMVAPTPVSAYLHSSAMVAAGFFLLARLFSVVEQSAPVVEAVTWLGLVSIGVGGLLALTASRLKRILAYSTVAQYGYGLLLLGLGGEDGMYGAMLFMIVHAPSKAALFMVAGAVQQTTGAKRLSELGGLAGSLPHLAIAAAIACAALAALPGIIGFFKDEMLFEAAMRHGAIFAVCAVFAGALTLAYLLRFWIGIFGGSRRGESSEAGWQLWVPPLALTLPLVIGAFHIPPFAELAHHAAIATLGEPLAPPRLEFHLKARPSYAMALGAWLLGLLLWVGLRGDEPGVRLPDLVTQYGPERWYRESVRALDYVSRRLLRFEASTLRFRISWVLVPCAVLTAMAAFGFGGHFDYEIGGLSRSDLPLLLALLLAAVTAVGVSLPRDRAYMTFVLALTAVGFSLAAVFAFLGAPDVTLVAALVEILLTLVFLAVLPARESNADRELHAPPPRHRWLNTGVALASGGFAALIAWRVLSHPRLPEPASARYLEATAHAPELDVVGAILADFRGLDTLGEITVLAVMSLAIGSLAEARRNE